MKLSKLMFCTKSPNEHVSLRETPNNKIYVIAKFLVCIIG